MLAHIIRIKMSIHAQKIIARTHGLHIIKKKFLYMDCKNNNNTIKLSRNLKDNLVFLIISVRV